MNSISEKYRHAAGKSIILFSAFFSIPGILSAQAAQPVQAGSSILTNPALVFLMVMILFFAIIISVLGKTLVKLANYRAKHMDNTVKMVSLLFLATAFSWPGQTMAQSPEFPLPDQYFGIPAGVFYFISGLLILELFVIFRLMDVVNRLLHTRKAADAGEVPSHKPAGIWVKYFAPRHKEEGKAEAEGHVYDGIHELDNGMPPWLQYMFVITVFFGIAYLLHYHVWRTGPLQLAEYEKELADAAVQMEAYQKKSANRVDESNVTLLTEATALKEGKEIYHTHCTACHGQAGEGTVGPNLTDNYWIHGGGIRDIFKTIKYGVVEKGMKSWQADISPSQIQLVSSYIKSLVGTNPANPKEKQGDLWTETGKAKGDTIPALSDSLAIAGDTLRLSAAN